MLIGKHASGPYEGLYGVASTKGATERRPQKTAARLAEWSTLGILGPRNELEYHCKQQGRSALGMHVYAVKCSDLLLPSMLRGSASYLQSCSPLDALGKSTIPTGILAWRDVSWKTGLEALELRLDPVSADAIRLLQTKLLRSTPILKASSPSNDADGEFEPEDETETD